MIGKLLTSIVGTANDRELKRIATTLSEVNAFEPAMQAKTDAELRGMSDVFKAKLAGEFTLDDLLPEAFAVAREASIRILQMRPFDVQVVAGIVLHEGKIAEQRTGEGKTLSATMPVYLNALTGRGVHVVTVNDYLAKRDAEWMGQLYNFLGMSTGAIYHDLEEEPRRAAYQSDITYGTNNEFGFDYLRDNLKHRSNDLVQRDYYYAIVDEVDSILIDEARTPLIISGPVPESSEDYMRINAVVRALKKDHYEIDEKARNAMLTEEGVSEVEQRLGLDNIYNPDNSEILHKVENLLKAHNIYQRDKDYIVKGREVLLVDEFTGRLMPGRRLSEGLHQAIEAKEGVKVRDESQTYASISFQNYFRMYEKLAGMTGTAETEALEFKEIYKLDVLVIPTNKPMIRKDGADHIYADVHRKVAAIAADIQDCYQRGQPVLVGTTSIEKSEALSRVLKGGAIEDAFRLPSEEDEQPEVQFDEEGNPVEVMPNKKKKKAKRKGPSNWPPVNIPHNVLNARNHAEEASIVAQAGRFGKITIATNMAGRGTDIMLGGNPEALARDEVGGNATQKQYLKAFEKFKALCDEERQQVLEAGGLRIIGTERHESRRIDNQLRGRAGRQGDPGSSAFYLSLDDDLLRIFGQDKLKNIFSLVKVPEGEPLIAHSMADKLIERAQRQVEAHNFDIRKHLLKYDDVMNRQREVIYEIRREILFEGDLSERIREYLDEVPAGIIPEYAQGRHAELWDFEGLQSTFERKFNLRIEYDEDTFYSLTMEACIDDVRERLLKYYEEKEARVGSEIMRTAERYFLLNTLDQLWMSHLWNMDHLRDAVRFSGYAQQDPLIRYKQEAFAMFEEVMWKIAEDTVRHICLFELASEQQQESFQKKKKEPARITSQKESADTMGSLANARRAGGQQRQIDGEKAQPFKRADKKVGPNDPCPCGSGKKYKKCCRDKEKPL